MAVSTKKPKKLKVLQHPTYGWTNEAHHKAYNTACHSIAEIRGIEKLAISARKGRGRVVEELVGGKHRLFVKTNLGLYAARLLWFRVCPRPRREHGCASEAVIPMKIEIEHLDDGAILTGIGAVDGNRSRVIYDTGWADNTIEVLECIYDHLQEAICDEYDRDWKKVPEDMKEE